MKARHGRKAVCRRHAPALAGSRDSRLGGSNEGNSARVLDHFRVRRRPPAKLALSLSKGRGLPAANSARVLDRFKGGQ